MSKYGWFVSLCGALAIAGCQAPPGPDGLGLSRSDSNGGAVLASNELDRLGRQDLDAGNSGLAEQHFREAAEKNNQDSYAWTGLAAAYDNLKRFDLADKAYAQAIRLKGETASLINNLGYSYYLRGDRARALAELRRAAILDPGNPVVLNNMRLVRSGAQPTSHAAP